MTDPPTPKRRSASGPSIPRDQRTSRQIEITLAPLVREHLDEMQEADGATRSGFVAGLIEDEWARRVVDRDERRKIDDLRRRSSGLGR